MKLKELEKAGALRKCQCGGVAAYVPERKTPVGKPGAMLERAVCPACGNATRASRSREEISSEWNSAGWCGQAERPQPFVPFGPDWETAMMRKHKPELVMLVKFTCRERDALRATVRRLQAQLNRTELEEVVSRLAQRGLIMRGKTETGSSKVIKCGSALVGKAVEA